MRSKTNRRGATVAVALDRGRFGSVFVTTLLALALMALAGCNTTAGLGRDIESAGGALEETAEDAAD